MILVLKGWCSIIVGQGIVIYGKVPWNPVHNDTNIIQVTFFDKVLKFLWRSISMFKGKVAHELVAPAESQRMGHERHELNVRVVHFDQIRNQLLLKLSHRIWTAVRITFPRSSMHFIDIDRS